MARQKRKTSKKKTRETIDLGEPEQAYSCVCGFQTQNKRDFCRHVMLAALKDGKGTHKSAGKIDVSTGEVITPPRSQYNVVQQENIESNNGADREQEEQDSNQQAPKKKSKDAGGDGKRLLKTDTLDGAQQIRVIPRIYTMDYTPIMRAAQEAAVRFWNWREDMPLANFIDTCLYLFFEEKGITLCGYIVDDSLLEKEAAHAS